MQRRSAQCAASTPGHQLIGSPAVGTIAAEEIGHTSECTVTRRDANVRMGGLAVTTVQEVLRAYAPDLPESDFAADLRSKFEQVTGTGDVGLTEGEVDFISQHGSDTARAALANWDPEAERNRRNRIVEDSVQHVLVQTMSPAEAAAITEKSRSQINRDLQNGKLYGLSIGRHWRIPRWQFLARRALPGLEVVVPAIPDHLHPTVIEGFMRTPQDELGDRTPIEHLRTGGAPEVVAEMVADLARW